MKNKLLVLVLFAFYKLQSCETEVIDVPGNFGVVVKIVLKEAGTVVYGFQSEHSCHKQASFKSDGTFIAYTEYALDNNKKLFAQQTFKAGMAGVKAAALQHMYKRLASKSVE